MRDKGFLRQHIDSFDHFINHELAKIVEANKRIDSDAVGHKNWYMEYQSVEVGSPRYHHNYREEIVSPHECRIRDLTYAAPIIAKIKYTMGSKECEKKVLLGEMPIMLRSSKCVLR